MDICELGRGVSLINRDLATSCVPEQLDHVVECETNLRNWKAINVASEIKPLTKLVPFTIPAKVLPIATFNNQSKSVTGATHRLEDKRRYTNRQVMAMVPIAKGLTLDDKVSSSPSSLPIWDLGNAMLLTVE